MRHSEKLLRLKHFRKCHQSLKKGIARAIQTSPKKPFFMLIGQPESGKSTFIESAENILTRREVSLHPKLAPCILYTCEHAHWIEIPGDILIHVDQESKRHLCNAVKKIFHFFKAETVFSGVVVVLDLYDMLTRSKFSNDNRLNQTNQFLTTLNYAYNNKFSVDLFLNKSDLIPGFFEFFSHRDKEFREQSWGFSIQDPDKEKIETAFNRLIKKLNEQLIWRLRQETSTKKLNLIKEFPIKFEQLKARLSPLLAEHFQKLASLTNAKLSELHIISCRQFIVLENETINNSLKIIKPEKRKNNAIETEKNNAHALNLQHKNFFIKNSYQQIIKNSQQLLQIKHPSSKLAYYGFILLCATIVSGSIVFLSHQLSENLKIANQENTKLKQLSEELLTKDSEQKKPDIIQKTQQLQAINQLVKNLKEKQLRFTGSELIFPKNKSILKKATLMSDKFIATEWLPAFAYQLENFIQSNLAKNPEKSYIALKIYLSLYEGENSADVTYINQHLLQVLPPNISAMVAALPIVINKTKLPKVTINQAMLESTRNYFVTLPPKKLAYILLFSNIDSSKKIDINKELSNNLTLIVNKKNSVIPEIYTQDTFEHMMAFAIPQAADQALHGNDILGKITEKPKDADGTQLATFISSLRKEYTETYAKTWENVLENTMLNRANDLQQFHDQLKVLGSKRSPLLIFLETIGENTHFPAIESHSAKLAKLNSVLNATNKDKNSNPLFHSFIAIRELEKNTSSIINAHHPEKSAYQQLRQQLSNSHKENGSLSKLINAGNQLPPPLHLWMVTLSNQYYKLLATCAGNYINERWLSEITQPFHKKFSSKYPFNQKSKSEINLMDFNQFFAKNGALDTFELNYILPLLSQNQQGWDVNFRIASALQIPENVMQQLQNLAKIQVNYFGSKADTADIEFNIAVTSLPKNIKSIEFSTANKTIIFNSKNNSPQGFIWPEVSNNPALTITVTDTKNETKTMTFNGAWAWLKAIDEFSSPEQNTKEDNGHNSEIHLLIPSTTKEKIDVKLLFESDHQFNPQLLSTTWVPYWVFKTN